MKQTANSFNYRLQPHDQKPQLGYKTKIKLDFNNYKFKFLKYDNGFTVLDTVYFDFISSISQSKMDFDRTASVDFALMVENYISNQKNFVSKRKEDESVTLSNPIIEQSEIDDSEIVKDNSIIKVTLAHYVDIGFKKETTIKETKDVTVTLMNEQNTSTNKAENK